MNIHVSQLPITQSANGDATWRIEGDFHDIDLIREGGKFRFEVSERPETEDDFERDLTVNWTTAQVIAEIERIKHHGDLYDPREGRFLGILRSR